MKAIWSEDNWIQENQAGTEAVDVPEVVEPTADKIESAAKKAKPQVQQYQI